MSEIKLEKPKTIVFDRAKLTWMFTTPSPIGLPVRKFKCQFVENYLSQPISRAFIEKNNPSYRFKFKFEEIGVEDEDVRIPPTGGHVLMPKEIACEMWKDPHKIFQGEELTKFFKILIREVQNEIQLTLLDFWKMSASETYNSSATPLEFGTVD